MAGSLFIFFTFLGVATSRGQRLAAALVLVSPWVESLGQGAFMNAQGKSMSNKIKKKWHGFVELEHELIQTRMIQKPLLRVEVGKIACVGICELRPSLPTRYDPQYPSLLDFLSGCLVRVL